MNVSSFLRLPFTTDFTLLAGKKGLTNKITGVNILDNPKATDWLSPGELIVTSGYFFKDSTSIQEQFLQSFKRLNIAAICIKPQIYLSPVPKTLLDLCDRLAIPLIEIPYGVAFSKIMETVTNLLSNSATQAVQMALDMNSEFLEYGLKGDGIDYLKEKLEALLENPLIIVSPDWRLITSQPAEAFSPYLTETHGSLSLDKSQIDSLSPNINKLKHPSTVTFKEGHNGLILPVFFNDVTYGYIIVLQQNKPLEKKDYIVLEHVSITIALEIVHQTEKLRISNKVQRDFYRELLFGTHEIEELKAFTIEFDFTIPYGVFIISLETLPTKGSLAQQKYEEEQLMNTIFNAAKHYQHPLYSDIHLFKQANNFIGLVGDTKPNAPKEELDRQFFTDFQKYLLTTSQKLVSVTIFVGSIKPIPQLKESYREAKQIARYENHQDNGLYFAKQYYFEIFLHQQLDTSHAKAFVEHFLAPLLTHDQENNSHLLVTLETFLESYHNLAVASRSLFIHRNTLLYRLEKIEHVLGLSLSDYQTSLSLSFALKLLKEFP